MPTLNEAQADEQRAIESALRWIGLGCEKDGLDASLISALRLLSTDYTRRKGITDEYISYGARMNAARIKAEKNAEDLKEVLAAYRYDTQRFKHAVKQLLAAIESARIKSAENNRGIPRDFLGQQEAALGEWLREEREKQ